MNDLEKEFIPYQQGLDMKELGFDEPCFTSYDNEGEIRNPFDFSEPYCRYIEVSKHFVYNSKLTIDNFNGPKHLYTQFIAAPTFSQAFRWFREKYKIRFFIQSGMSDLGEFFKVIFPIGEVRSMSYSTYEEAELECLKKLIEITKSGSLKV